MLKRPEMDVEILLNSGETRYTFPNASFSLLARNQEEENAPDVIGTLENYFDHQFLAAYELEIKNDGTIYEVPFKDLINYDDFYGYVEKKYGKKGEK
jgi:hypothetical protein